MQNMIQQLYIRVMYYIAITLIINDVQNSCQKLSGGFIQEILSLKLCLK